MAIEHKLKVVHLDGAVGHQSALSVVAPSWPAAVVARSAWPSDKTELRARPRECAPRNAAHPDPGAGGKPTPPKEESVPVRSFRVGNVSGGSSVDLAEMAYTLEGGCFDRFPYAPYVPPGTVRPASHNDRRVLGRRGGQLLSVTDLPAHFLHPSESPDYAYTSQNFEFAGDFTTWILETCRRTRFTSAAASLPAADRLTVAVTATKTGLEWDLAGNIVIVDRRSWQAHSGHRTDSYVLHVTGLDDGAWELIETSTARRLHKDHAETRAVLSRNLRDVGTDGSPFGFQIRYVPSAP